MAIDPAVPADPTAPAGPAGAAPQSAAPPPGSASSESAGPPPGPAALPPSVVPTVAVSATALLVVDMQNGFCHPDGSFARAGADVAGMGAAVPGCVALIDAAHAAGVPVCFTRAVHEPGLADWPVLAELPMYAGLVAIGSCEEGTWDAELVDGLPVGPDDRVYVKSRFSPFVETSIEADLHAAGTTSVVVCGVGTSACVESTVRDASQRSLRTFVAREATGDLSPDAAAHSIAVMGSLFGYEMGVADIVAAWMPR